ncbi:unnamed protein product [Ectocarpus sp. 6 AP-2014]
MDVSRATLVKPGDNRDAGGGTCLRPILFGMRRSCSECGRKKKSCDGDRPCRRCVQTGNQCTYSKRRWHLHQPNEERRELQRPNDECAHGREAVLESTRPEARPTSGMLAMKRYRRLRFRFSASLATGLVGMRENVFLSDFFGCFGFLPLTTRGYIREAMVKIMTTRSSLRQSVGADCDDEGHFHGIESGAEWITTSERNQLPMDPSTCTFWCAIALGALAKGSPVGSVSKYCELAQEALPKSDSGPADLEVVTAWVVLAYLYGFMGNLVHFQEYLALSDSFLTSSIEQGSADMLPVGFAEVVKHTQLMADASVGPWQMKSCSAQEQAIPQLKKAATKVELYKYAAQSLRAFVEAAQANARTQRSMACEHECEATSDGRSSTGLRSEKVLLPREVVDAMETASRRGNVLNFEPLEQAVDQPSVRGGIGSLFIDAILVFTKAEKGDLDAAVERMVRCVEIFERYPGLCRSMIGFHMAHTTLVCLAAIGGPRHGAAYDRLRGSYNSFRPSGSRPVPRLDEWQGVDAFCDDFYCRAIDLIASKMKAIATPPVDNIDVCVKTKSMDSDKGGTGFRGRWENQSDNVSAGDVAEKTICTAVPACPTEGEAEYCRASTKASTAPKGPLSLLGMSDGGGVVEDTEDYISSVGAGNWLDVTHAMLDAI